MNVKLGPDNMLCQAAPQKRHAVITDQALGSTAIKSYRLETDYKVQTEKCTPLSRNVQHITTLSPHTLATASPSSLLPLPYRPDINTYKFLYCHKQI